jgi:hypothetical protein
MGRGSLDVHGQPVQPVNNVLAGTHGASLRESARLKKPGRISTGRLGRWIPIRGKFEGPDLVAERLGMTAGDPQLVLKHERRVFVPGFPAGVRLE